MLPRLSLLGLAALALVPMAALAFVPSAPLRHCQQQRQHQQQQQPLTRMAAAPAAAGTDVVLETFILPMGDDTQLKIRLRPDTFKDLVARTNQVRVGAWAGVGLFLEKPVRTALTSHT